MLTKVFQSSPKNWSLWNCGQGNFDFRGNFWFSRSGYFDFDGILGFRCQETLIFAENFGFRGIIGLVVQERNRKIERATE